MYGNLKERWELLIRMINYLAKNKEKSDVNKFYEMFYEVNLKDSTRARSILVSIINFESQRDWKKLYDELDTELTYVDEAYYKLSY